MILLEDETGRIAVQYIALHGPRANVLIGDDINRAIDQQDWDEVHRLRRAQFRIRRFQLREQIAQRFPGTRYVGLSPNQGLPAARNAGLAEATGDSPSINPIAVGTSIPAITQPQRRIGTTVIATKDAPAGGKNPAAVSFTSPFQITESPRSTHSVPTTSVMRGPVVAATSASDSTS